MSDVFTASVKDGVSPVLRGIGHISFEQDVRPAMKNVMGIVETTLRDHISENGYGYRLDKHAQRGVRSRSWSVTSQSMTLGFTTYLDPWEWLYIFNDGTYKSGTRYTRKAYRTDPYTDRLGRHVPARKYKAGISRGSIPALGFLDSTRQALSGNIFSILRRDIETAVNARLQQI